MGQRVNYILIENNRQTIHYNHWRANCITKDLYLGEKRFIEYVKSCNIKEVILDEPWIEGIVIINLPQKLLYFWTMEFEYSTVMQMYLDELNHKWKHWKISLLINRMYDAEKILNINYVAEQKLTEIETAQVDDIINDSIDEWKTATVIIKSISDTRVIQTGSINCEQILSLGQPVLDILLTKPNCELPIENKDCPYECMIIDIEGKEIILDRSEFGLWENVGKKWEGYQFKMGDYYYVGALQLAGIDTKKVVMTNEVASEALTDMVKQNSDFDPLSMAKKMLQEDKDIKFNPDFFDNAKPPKTFTEKLNSVLQKYMNLFRSHK